MVCTGAKNEEESKIAARKYARIIQKLGFPAQFSNFKIENIVGSSNVKFPIDLELISTMHNSFCSVGPHSSSMSLRFSLVLYTECSNLRLSS